MRKGTSTMLGFGMHHLIWGIAVGIIVILFAIALYYNTLGGWSPEKIVG